MKLIFSSVFILFIWCDNSFAQNTYATITCHVYDVETENPIVDASIKVNDVRIGNTDSSGNILLENVTPGKYLIWAFVNKYFSKRIDSISIQAYENHCI